jgi:hypothetical protein
LGKSRPRRPAKKAVSIDVVRLLKRFYGGDKIWRHLENRHKKTKKKIASPH